jgi:hypothetical protein
MAKSRPRWKKRLEPQDRQAALRFLSLQFTQATTQSLIDKARRTPCIEHIAKDLLRASNLPLLTADEKHVAEDLKRIRKGKPLAPVLMIQGDVTRNRPVVIADGYHRICATCHADEDAPVAVVLVRW